MKKPQYTRQTKYVFDEDRAYCSERALQELLQIKKEYLIEQKTSAISKKKLILKKEYNNSYIRSMSKLLKRYVRRDEKHKPKTLDIFEYASPECSPEAISLVRNSPEVIEYLQKAYADIQSSPFKGLFCWYVADVCRISVFPLERDHLGQCNLRMHNRAWSYDRVLNRLFMQYPYRRFKPCK